MKSAIIVMMEMADQLKIYHWQTKSFAEHKALGKVYDALVDRTDDFVEVFMGKYGRMKLDRTDTIEIENYSPEALRQYVDVCVEFLTSLNSQLDAKKDSDLLNIRDDMLGELNRLKYLLTLS